MKLRDYKKHRKVEETNIFVLIKKHLISAIVGIIVIIYLFSKVDLNETIKHISSFPFYLVIVVFLITVVLNGLWIFRWRIIIKKISDIGYWVLWPIFLAGGLFNQLTPGTTSGGQPLRAYYLNKINHKGYGNNLATVLFEFLSGSFTSLILIIFSLFYLSKRFPFSAYYSVVGALVIVILLTVWLIYFAYKIETESIIARKCLRLFFKFHFIKKRFKNFKEFKESVFLGIREFFRESFSFLGDKWLVVQQMFIEFIIYMFEFSKVYILFLALGVEVPFVIIIVAGVLSELVGFLMFSPGGFGVVEGSMVGIYYLFGINPEIAAAVIIVNRAMIYIIDFVFGYVSFLYVQKKYVK